MTNDIDYNILVWTTMFVLVNYTNPAFTLMNITK